MRAKISEAEKAREERAADLERRAARAAAARQGRRRLPGPPFARQATAVLDRATATVQRRASRRGLDKGLTAQRG